MPKITVSQTARSVPFDNTGTSFISDNVQDVINEIGSLRFPRKIILATESYKVYDIECMVTYQELDILGELDNEGETVIII